MVTEPKEQERKTGDTNREPVNVNPTSMTVLNVNALKPLLYKENTVPAIKSKLHIVYRVHTLSISTHINGSLKTKAKNKQNPKTIYTTNASKLEQTSSYCCPVVSKSKGMIITRH